MATNLTFQPGQYRYPNGANLTADAGFTFTSGRKLNSSYSGVLTPFPLNGAQGVQIRFGAAAASNNDAFTARIFVGYSSQGVIAGNTASPDTAWQFYGSAAVTLSSVVVGVANGIVGTTDLLADTIVWTLGTTATTPVGIGQAIETAYASPGSVAFSPADNATCAVLFIPHLGWADYLMIDMDPTTGATKAFALISRH